MAASDWADELDIPLSRILGRLKNGWSVEKALTAPKLKSNGATA
jgi:hypothetical protein